MSKTNKKQCDPKSILRNQGMKMSVKTRFLSYTQKLLILLFSAALTLHSTGCDKKEKVLDVETPAGGIEIEKDKDSGNVDIEIKDK